MTEATHNPYHAPSTQTDVPQNGQPVGLVATLLVAAAAVFAGVCTFFFTCFGLGIVVVPVFSGSAVLLLFVLIPCCLVAALVVAQRLYNRLLTYLKHRATKNNSPADVPFKGPEDAAK